MLNLAFLLDITGSMGSQVEGVKATVRQLVASVFAEEYDVMLTVITFTESGRGCYVTNHQFTDGDEAQKFIGALQLGVPPGTHGVNANGGDGDENHKAALAQLLTLDNSMPTVAFLITDAGPHLVADRATPEATHEVNYLKTMHSILDCDLFHIVELVRAHFEHNLMLNVVKYTRNSDHRLYAAVAKQLGGVLMTPQQGETAQELSAGLFSILSQMFSRSLGTGANEAAEVSTDGLGAFVFYQLGDVEPVTRESQLAKRTQPEAADTKDVLFSFLERATVVIGGKFAKRAVEAAALREQVELLLVVAQCLTKSLSFNAALDRATILVNQIREQLPEENQGHLKLRVDNLPRILREAIDMADTVDGGEAVTALSAETVSAITLMTTEEAARDALDEADAFDAGVVLQTAASLFLAHLAVLQLPVKNERPDFMDSWSAVISHLSGDVVTAKDFLQLIASDEATGGLSDRDRAYNYAQIAADPSDKLGSALLSVASRTQVLDILTALLAGAPAGKFCPNMFQGTSAAALMGLLLPPSTTSDDTGDHKLNEFQRQLVRKLVHSIRLVARRPSAAVAVEPESALSKLVFQLLRLQPERDDNKSGLGRRELVVKALPAVLEELLAAQIQRVAKYNESAFLALVEHVVQYEHVADATDAMKPHPLDLAQWAFDPAEAQARAAQAPVVAWFRVAAQNVIEAVLGGEEDGEPLPTLDALWPTLEQQLPKLLLLQKRTARYELSGQGEAKAAEQPEWRRNDAVLRQALDSDAFEVLAMTALRRKHDAFLRDLRARRQDVQAEWRWQVALATMRADMPAFLDDLKRSVVDSSSREHRLLLRAFKTVGVHELPPKQYEAKLVALITGRHPRTGKIVFNRGNLHPDPTRFVPLSAEFQSKLRAAQRANGWSLAHKYRPSNAPNHSGHCNANPSAWAARRSLADKTFWELD